MKYTKRVLPLILAAAMVLGMSMSTRAVSQNTEFDDVDANAWYAEAVAYCQEQGWMSGTSATAFSPTGEMTRAMLATVLYRKEGSPAVSGQNAFIDTVTGTWYSNAILWANQTGLVTGYGNGLFGTNDPVSREQMVTILWRYEGSPAAQIEASFADKESISNWALPAVNWAAENQVVNGRTDNRFDPKGNANRAEIATVLANAARTIWAEPTPTPTPELTVAPTPTPTPSRRPSSGGSSSGGGAGSSSGNNSSTTPTTPTPTPVETKRVLVAYFSGTGTTRGVAQTLTAALGDDVATLHEITPQQPYTAADLDYTNSNCRSVTEQHDPNARPAISGSVANMADYDIVFLGYPIWNNDAPRIIYTFLESEELSGKTIIPFCTSGGSSISNSVSNIQGLVSNATWLAGRRCYSSDSISTLASWVNGLDLDFTPAAGNDPKPAPAPTPAPTPEPEPDTSPKALVVYFSATNNTENIANHIHDLTGAALFEIIPAVPYTSADLNYNTDCRANREQNDASARPEIAENCKLDNMDDYDIIFLGYPIWWGQAPKIIYTFLESYDFSGKTIVPFCTSASSGVGSSATNLYGAASGAVWKDGYRFSGSASQSAVESWLNGLGLSLTK